MVRAKLMLKTGLSAVLAVSGAPLAAQTTQQSPSESSPTAEAPAATDENASDDIVVTATRRDERLQSVPIAVSAISGDQLQRTGITNTRELTQTMPALVFSRVNATFQPVIRGVGTRGTGGGDESNVAVYIDGVYQADTSSLAVDLLNVDRVEVLRGPQGTLFGRNSTGGLINVITSAPSHDGQLRALFRYGRFNERSAQIYATGGLSDTLTMSLSGQVRQDDGYVRNLVTGRTVGQRNVYGVRGKILFEPSSTARFTLTGSHSYANDDASVQANPEGGNTQARALANDPRTLVTTTPYTTAPTQPQFLNTRATSASLDGIIDLGAVSLQSTTAFQRNRRTISVETDATPFNIGYTHSDKAPSGSNNHSQELRLLSQGDGPFSFILGGFYFNARAFLNPTTSTTRGIDSDIFSEQRTRSLAGFGEATYRIADSWKFIAGLRYTTETRKFDGRTIRLGVATSSISGAITTFDQITYRGIIQREFGWGNTYASYSRGFKSGVFNDFSTASNSRATRPEVLDAYEIGLKSDPFPGIRFSLSAFHYDYKDIQLSSRDPSTALVVLLNAATAKLNGGEAELTARLAKGLNIRAYATYLDAKYTRFPDAQIFVPVFQDQTAIGGSARTPIGNVQQIVDVSGSRMIRAPKYTLGGSFDYTVETSSGSLGATANVFYTDRYYWDVNNRLLQPAYTQVNGELSWTAPNEKLRISVWAQNLTNTVIQQQVTPSAALDGVTYDRPRTYGISLGISL